LPAFGLHILPRLIAGFVQDKPDASVVLQVRTSPKVIDWVMAQQVDVGISLLPVDHPAVRVERVASVDAVCVLPLGHALAGRALINAVDLRGEMFISLGREDRSRHMIDRVFDEAGVARLMRLETHLSEVACVFVANGAGVSIVDPFTAADFATGRIVVRPFEPKIRFDIYLLFPAFRPRSLLLDAFVDALKQEVARIAPLSKT
jgi:DNA-binding transcriptional LysR family regulator